MCIYIYFLCRSLDTLKFYPGASQFIKVTFHVVLPYRLWEFDKSHGEIKLRFGGHWNKDFGMFEIERYKLTTIFSDVFEIYFSILFSDII